MKDLFLDVFKYHHHFNEKLLEEILAHQDQLPATVLPLFCHCLNAHQVWNARILGKPSTGAWEVHSAEKCRELNEQNLQDSLHILMELDLHRKINYTNSAGASYTNAVREILFHVANHHTHHRGQIIATFRQCGIEPLLTDYIFYKR